MLTWARTWWIQWQFIKRARVGRPCEELRLLWRGDLDAARAALGPANSPRAALRLACIELEAGDHAAAERWSCQLGDDPAARVLTRLIGARAAGPRSWLDALEAAWADAGRPDLRASAVLDDDIGASRDLGDPRELSDDDHMLWLKMTWELGLFRRKHPRAYRRWTARLDPRWELDLVVVAASARDPSSYGEALERLVELAGDNLWVRLARMLQRGGTSISTDDERELEVVLASPHVDLAVSDQVYPRMTRVARAAGSGSPEVLGWIGAAKSLPVPAIDQLFSRLRATTGSAGQRAAALCRRLAERMREDRFVLTAAIANALDLQARTVLNPAISPILHPDHARLLDASKFMPLNPGRWPLPSLQREAIEATSRHELAFFQRYFETTSTPQA
jgi:hypothetical protein